MCWLPTRRSNASGSTNSWWMVTPGSPLKDHNNLAPLADRIAMSETIARDPRIKVTAFEKALGQSYTARTLDIVRARNRDIRFVWIMGADNLRSFHRWQNWRKIARTFPIAVIDRPGSTLAYLLAHGQDLRLCPHRRGPRTAPRFHAAPAWTFIHGPRSSMSSTALRAATAAPSKSEPI